MYVFIEALSASAGGGLTYIRNVLPHLAAHPEVRVTLLMRREYAAGLADAENISVRFTFRLTS